MKSVKNLWLKLTGKLDKNYASWGGFFIVGMWANGKWDVVANTYSPLLAVRTYFQMKRNLRSDYAKAVYFRWHPWMKASRIFYTAPVK